MKQAGFTLLEVVLAIAVFAFGLLALVELQTGLVGSASDANLRTVAINIAEELVEERRGFIGIDADPDNDYFEYEEILTFDDVETYSVVRDEGEGVVLTANLIVQDYYWDADTETFVTTAPVGIVNSDYKTMDIIVMWRPLEGDETFDDHDTIQLAGLGGGVRIVESLPSAPPVLGAMVAAARDVDGGPQVVYNPGENPEIIRITLDGDGGKFKESTMPLPDVIRDDKVETWFDVVTFSQSGDDDAVFLRREEFAMITCGCELETAPADYVGLKPTLWNGVDYTEGEVAVKPIGIPAGPASQQSMFCGVCCRDHHDGAGSTAEDVYSLEFVGDGSDHPHYNVDGRGDLDPTPVVDGDEYIEACRLIRKSGFMRVTHDANQGAMIAFPEGYLEADEGVENYSAYVTESAGEYFADGLDTFPQPNPPDVDSPHSFPGRATDDATALPTPILTTTQQLRARGVYVDYLTTAAQDVIDACFPLVDRSDDCPAPNTSTEFEIYPFFDLQLTLLARWNDASLAGLVSVTNEAIETGNVHSRGFLALESVDSGQSRIEITSYNDNQGLTAATPIAPGFLLRETTDSIYVDANGDDSPAPPIGSLVSGNLSSTLRRVPAADIELVSSDALCNTTDTEWACVVFEIPAFLNVTNYYLNMPRTYACSELTFYDEQTGPPASDHYTVFELPLSGIYDIWITDDFADCER
jgi:prepilin-type N-terminal cleavage/methylation domain-containing protein